MSLKLRPHLGCRRVEEFPKSNQRTHVSVKGPGLSGENITSRKMKSDRPAWPRSKASGPDRRVFLISSLKISQAGAHLVFLLVEILIPFTLSQPRLSSFNFLVHRTE